MDDSDVDEAEGRGESAGDTAADASESVAMAAVTVRRWAGLREATEEEAMAKVGPVRSIGVVVEVVVQRKREEAAALMYKNKVFRQGLGETVVVGFKFVGGIVEPSKQERHRSLNQFQNAAVK